MPICNGLFARSAAVFVAAATTLSACGGGGSSHTAVAQVAPTPSPSPTASSGPTCSSIDRRGIGKLAANYAGVSWVVPNRLAVTYRPSAASRAPQSIDRVVNAVASVDLGTMGANGHRIVTLPPGTDAATAAAQLRKSADVVSVDPVHYRRPLSYPTVPTSYGNDLVNDTYSDNVDQWYLYITNTDPAAWRTTTGSSAVSIAVIDTGVDEKNTDISSKLVFRESVVTGPTGQTINTAPGSAQDTDGHGTNVAGLAAAATNNAYGFAGVGYKTSLQAYKIFPDDTPSNPCPSADTADEVRAINDAVKNGASIINLSLGGAQSAGADATEQAAIEAAIQAGVTVVAADGNEYGAPPDYPAAYPGVIAVGASAVADDGVGATYGAITSETVASYSNNNPTLVAPGGDANNNQNDSDVLHWITGYDTTTPGVPANGCTDTNNVCVALFNGTSQATPQVAGAIALMMAAHGGAHSLTPAQVASLLSANSDPIPNVSTARQGAGRLDAAKAVAAAAALP